VPTAPAQGAIAIETAAGATAARTILEQMNDAPTWRAVTRERAELARRGGGCHAALGATVLVRPYGEVLSLRAIGASGAESVWDLNTSRPPVPHAARDRIWPTPAERARRLRRPLDVPQPDVDAFFVARAEALPAAWRIRPAHVVWAAGGRTWRKLAARGIWVHGCADGLGDLEAPRVDALAGRALRWCRLTHTGAETPDAVATYHVDDTLPDDLPARTHFFWTSGSQLRKALEHWPALSDRWHGSGPGRTAQALRELVGPVGRSAVWLDYDHWLYEVTTR
jgi:hydroxymethylbilane synthase